jgi:hypothetical protein
MIPAASLLPALEHEAARHEAREFSDEEEHERLS